MDLLFSLSYEVWNVTNDFRLSQARNMIRDEGIIGRINALWLPVYPFMAGHLLALSGVCSGRVLDLGPFAGGLAVSLLRQGGELHATVMDESQRVLDWAEQQARAEGCLSRLVLTRAAIEPIAAPDASFDLVVVRGAFFFLTSRLLCEVKRVLRAGGLAWVGGGYGPLTPQRVIAPIAERSKQW
ncbi:MAG TPA: class I SAM-dependent methyltransferase, partial [Terriglobales bacterium]|nr:class I SAM-dependent methyltransferase [Terriglobales bacterium]